MSELIDCINNLSAKDIIKSVAKTANGTPFYLQTTGGGVSFLPTDLANLYLWLRSDLGITLNGTDVSLWEDQSTTGYDFDQIVAADQPSYQLAQINGYPSVTFDGVSEFLEGVAGDLDLSTWHIFMVINNFTYALGRNVGNKDYAGNSDPSQITTRDDAAVDAFSFANVTGWHLAEITCVEGATTNAWRDGLASVSNPLGAQTWEFDAMGNYRGGVAFSSGKAVEYIIYSDIKTGSDLTAIKNYIATRYALTIV